MKKNNITPDYLGNWGGKDIKTQSRNVFDIDGIAPTISTGWGSDQPFVLLEEENEREYNNNSNRSNG